MSVTTIKIGYPVLNLKATPLKSLFWGKYVIPIDFMFKLFVQNKKKQGMGRFPSTKPIQNFDKVGR